MIDVSLTVRDIAVRQKRRVRYIRSIDQIPNIPPQEREKLRKVADR